MQNIKFELRPYLRYDGSVDNDWLELTLVINEEAIKHDTVNSYRWKDADEQTRQKHCFYLIDESLEQALLNKKASFVEESLYKSWYEFQFHIDGEDAIDFIRRVPRTKHPRTFSGFQAAMAVETGWVYYKKLVNAGFNKTTAANLAYWRGYIDGMDMNNAFDKEGTEALDLMGLKYIKTK